MWTGPEATSLRIRFATTPGRIGRPGAELDAVADDKTKAGGQDRSRVNIHEDYEVQYWTKKWGVSRAQLEAAVKAVGPMATDVAKHLGKSH